MEGVQLPWASLPCAGHLMLQMKHLIWRCGQSCPTGKASHGEYCLSTVGVARCVKSLLDPPIPRPEVR